MKIMRLLLLLLAAPWLLAAADWIRFTSGPFEVLTDDNERAARETLVRFEQFRHGVGQVIGEQDISTPLPVRVFVLKDPKPWTPPAVLAEGRDAYGIVFGEKSTPSPELYRALTRLFLESNTARMPPAFEDGLVDFFSTFSVTGIRNTVGAPPPNPNLNWARVHLLIVDPEYYGKIRVLLGNLRRGVAEDVSYRNAFGKPPAEIDSQVKAHLAAGNFQTTSLSSRPMSARDFHERPVSDADARLARADLLLAGRSATEYQALLREGVKVAEAEEGLGLLALREGNKDEARKRFSTAMEAGSGSARCYIEYAKLESDNAKAERALLKAAGINPKLDEPFALLAQRDADPLRRRAHWKAAAERNPRNASYWKALAESYLAENNFAEAAKAWTAGEQAAVDPAERARMRQARQAIEEQRAEYEAAARKRAAEEEARELEKLKSEARAEVRAIEAKANEGAAKSAEKPVPWWDGPAAPGKVSGALTQVDCLGSQARLTVRGNDGKNTRLLVTDPSKVAINGPGDIALGCGAQTGRRVTVQYSPKVNTRLGTAGEVASIEFQ